MKVLCLDVSTCKIRKGELVLPPSRLAIEYYGFLSARRADKKRPRASAPGGAPRVLSASRRCEAAQRSRSPEQRLGRSARPNRMVVSRLWVHQNGLGEHVRPQNGFVKVCEAM